MSIERSWLKDALDRALAEPVRKATAVREFIDNVIVGGNKNETPTQYRGLKKEKDAA